MKLKHGLGIFFMSLIFITTGCLKAKIKEGLKEMKDQDSFAHVDGTDFLKECKKHIENSKRLRNSLVEYGSKNDLYALNIYNDILFELDKANGQASLLSQVHPLEKIRKNAESCEQELSKFVTDLSLDKHVYLTLKSIDDSGLDEKAKRMLTQVLRDFERSGVDKDDACREKIKALKEELVIIGQEFGQNIIKDRFVIELDNEEDLAGLPIDYIKSHKPNKNLKIEISTDYPDYIPFMKYAKSNKWRKELRFKYLNRGKANDVVLKKMIEKRHELANLLGYKSYADYIVKDKMIKEAAAIHGFIEKVSKLSKNGADKEFKELLNFKKKFDKNANTIEGYESAYLEEGFKKEHFQFDSKEARNYFSYPKVRDGLLKITSELFNIQYHKAMDSSPWHFSVEAYDVYEDNKKLGRIYLDMHPRDGKYKHAAQFTIRSGLKDRQYPEGALVCNFPKPSVEDPYALMEHREVVTFFHEFGHLLHHIFAGRQEWMRFSGVATEWDFVEAPSQFFEEWAWSHDVLKTFAFHYQTKEPISKNLVTKMRAAEEFGKAIGLRQQMFYAALSVNYFDEDPNKIDLLKMLQEAQKKYSYYPYEEGTHFYNGFGHLDGYSAMYYTYGWSLSIAKDLLTPFKKQGLMNRDLAEKYKEIVLKQGGSKDAKDLVYEFLGRPFQFDAFENWLLSDNRAVNLF